MKIVCHGESLIDLVNKGDGSFYPFAGGAVYNLARAVAAQSIETFYLNPISRDKFGDLLRIGLAASSVKLATPQPSGLSTSLAIANLDTDGKAHYSFYRTEVADSSLSATELIETTKALSSIDLACTGCLALTPTGIEATLGWLEWCKLSGITTLIDINMRHAAVDNFEDYHRGVMQALQFADIVKLSDEDANDLFDSNPSAVISAQKIFDTGPAELVCFTQGRLGAQVLSRDQNRWLGRETRDLVIADTVGAGDCFTAGFLASLFASTAHKPAHGALKQWIRENPQVIEKSLQHALATASLCVQQHGAAAPTSEQVQRWLEQGSIYVEQFA